MVQRGGLLRRILRHREGPDVLLPIRSDGTKWQIVQGLKLTDFSKERIAATEKELKEEKALVSELLPK